MTAQEIADAWIDNHRPREWKQLLADCEETPVLPDHVISWLAEFVPGFKDRVRSDFATGTELARRKALGQFEEAFIAQLSSAVERPG
jgi:hypothetical protein